MKKSFILILFSFLISQTGNAQAFAKGDILVDFGVGLGVYGTTLKTEVNGISGEETDGAASVIVPVKLQYGVSNKFSLGLLFQSATYIIDSADVNNEDADGIAFRFIASYYLVNKDKFKLFLEMGLGAATFNQNTEKANGDESEAEWGGGNFAVGLGLKHYFSKHIGFFTMAQFNNYAFDLDNLRLNNSTFDINNWEANFSGAEISVGLAIKF